MLVMKSEDHTHKTRVYDMRSTQVTHSDFSCNKIIIRLSFFSERRRIFWTQHEHEKSMKQKSSNKQI